MKRVLALVGAILLIVLAVVLRAVLAGDGDGTGNGNGDDPGDDGDTELVVACIPELRDACEAIDRPIAELRIEDPGDTIASLEAGEEIDAWVTLDPWPEIANQLLGRDVIRGSESVAWAGLVLLTRRDAIPSACPDFPTWTCLVDELGDQVAIPPPTTALGLLLQADAANDFRPDFAANELRDDFELLERLDALDTSMRDPAGEMLLLPDPDVAGTTTADVDSRIARSAAYPNLAAIPNARGASVAVVVAGPDADRIAGEPSFTDGLEALGWMLDPGHRSTQLPDPGRLIALQRAGQ